MSLTHRIRDLAGAVTYPLEIDDLLGVLDPTASGRQLRAQVAAVRRPAPDAVTLLLRPARGWVRHRAGQWIRVGVEIDGVRHWRSYSLTSAAGTMPAITVTDVGLVSGHLVRHARKGDVLAIETPEGDFTLPDRPRPLLFLTGGSGITPVISMLRTLVASRTDADVVVLHSARSEAEDLFTTELDELGGTGLRVVRRWTSEEGRLDLSTTADLDLLVPDWRRRAAYACGPESLLEAARELWAAAETTHDLMLERFAAVPVPETSAEDGGRVTFTISDLELDTDGGTPLLAAGEDAGVLMPSGCRMGICRTCLTRLVSGQVRDLTNGQVHGEPGDLVRTCVSAPAGDVVIDR